MKYNSAKRYESEVLNLVHSRFRIESLLGESNFSYVFKVRDSCGQYHAAKFLKEELQEIKPWIIKEEARRLEKVSGHPGIIQFHDFLENRILLMEVFGESNLWGYSSVNNLSSPEIRKVRDEIADALLYGHEQGVIHRDVKTTNILIESQQGSLLEQRIKLIDYGLSSRLELRAVYSGFIFGTPGHIAPELIFKELTTPETDLYALGATLFYLATSSLEQEIYTISQPFIHSKLAETNLPAELKESIKTLLGNDPGQRKQGLKEKTNLLKRLHRLIDH